MKSRALCLSIRMHRLKSINFFIEFKTEIAYFASICVIVAIIVIITEIIMIFIRVILMREWKKKK